MEKENHACPKCGYQDSVRHGYRYNKSGAKRLRKCKGCGARFTPDDGFLRRRFQKEHIVRAVSLHQSGLSLGKVKEHMLEHHGVEVSRWMISLWCRDYYKMMDEFTGTVKPDVKGNTAGGVIVKVNGKKNWLDDTYEGKTVY